MTITIGNKTIASIHFSDVETAWKIENAMDVFDYFKKMNCIILGGDILDEHLEYTYDNWYYNPKSDLDMQTNIDCSVRVAKEYISKYQQRNGNRFYVVIVVE